jgi:hypothetical protein
MLLTTIQFHLWQTITRMLTDCILMYNRITDAISMLWKWCMSCRYVITGFSLTTANHIMWCCDTVRCNHNCWNTTLFSCSTVQLPVATVQPCSWKDMAHSPFSTCGLILQMSRTKLSANQYADHGQLQYCDWSPALPIGGGVYWAWEWMFWVRDTWTYAVAFCSSSFVL